MLVVREEAFGALGCRKVLTGFHATVRGLNLYQSIHRIDSASPRSDKRN